MKTTIITAAIVLLTATADATTYQGTFDSEWITSPFENRPVIATVDATSDGVNFQIDSMVVQFTDTLQGEGSFTGSALDPIAVSINMFTESQLLNFVPNSDVASITPLSFGWDIQYTGVYREGISFDVINKDSQAAIGTRNTDTLFDFGTADEITMTFSTSPALWTLPLFSIPGFAIGSSLSVPISPVVLRAIPEPSTSGLALAATLSLAMCRRRSF